MTPAWLVVWNGKPGPAHILGGAVLRDVDGQLVPVFEGEFEACEVVDREQS